MNHQDFWLWLADAVLLLHGLIVLWIVMGLVLILIGGAAGWCWVRNRYFRYSHLMAIAVVVTQAWLGLVCPLTTLEQWLRLRAGASSYQGGFIQHWVLQLLYYDFSLWVFTFGYTIFAVLVIVAWCKYPAQRRRLEKATIWSKVTELTMPQSLNQRSD